MAVLLAAPSFVPPPVEFDPWTSSRHSWIDPDGNEWDLSHGASGLWLNSGVRGLRMPPINRYTSKAAAVAGSMWRGSITDERECFWPLDVYADGSALEWYAHNARFWKTLNPGRTGVWRVTQPSREFRDLRVRYSALQDDSDDIDPGLVGWALYGINMVAEQPHWLGPTITAGPFTAATSPVNFFGAGAGGPPFWLMPSSTTDLATITNPGDVEAWPVWEVKGPTTAVSMGLDGRMITLPVTLTTGQTRTIDTAPTSQVLIDQAGVDRSSEVGSDNFAEVPAGAEVPLTIAITGTGSVTCSIRPPYYQAY